MSDTNPGSHPGEFGPPQPPQQPPPPPAYGQPQNPPVYGYPQAAYPPAAYPPAPPVGYPQAAGYVMQVQPSNGMGTTGLVLGIIGVVCSLTFFMWFIGVVLGILAIIFGAVGRGKAIRGEATNKGAATAGLVCGIVATVILPVLGFVVFASFMSVI
ncbi:DUF4190 domain-containing protein [Streptomyces sp. NPDC048290]|uniref:DUF4190 domain-containing protein n=1 Tax=Streptomyces sp. NPDC048290 TaxID=3155811 RepID=UPI003412EAD1